MTKKDSRKKKQYIIWGFLILLLFGEALFFCYYFFIPSDVKIVPVSFSVGDRLGFDVNTSALSFGEAFPGSVSTRFLEIENTHTFPVRIHMIGTESVARFMVFEEQLYFAPKEKKRIPITLQIPREITLQNYSGSLNIYIWRIRLIALPFIRILQTEN